MNMPKQQNDWDLLSAFVDGELSAAQEKNISERLKADAEFNMIHVQLLNTRKLMAKIPQVTIPKHFTLTEAMLPRSFFARLAPRRTWNFASAIASFIFILIVVGDIFTFGLGNIGLSQSAPEAAMAIEAAEADVSELAGAPEALDAGVEEQFFPESIDDAIEDEDQAEMAPVAKEDSGEIRIEEAKESVSLLSSIQIVRLSEIFFGGIALFGAWMGRRRKSA